MLQVDHRCTQNNNKQDTFFVLIPSRNNCHLRIHNRATKKMYSCTYWINTIVLVKCCKTWCHISPTPSHPWLGSNTGFSSLKTHCWHCKNHQSPIVTPTLHTDVHRKGSFLKLNILQQASMWTQAVGGREGYEWQGNKFWSGPSVLFRSLLVSGLLLVWINLIVLKIRL